MPSTEKYIILGTAGHIDHGKSALVKALTGIDPDRLKEEKERGITIDLGFAYLRYSDGIVVGIVDVPGHERLVKNMLAGAGGIDLLLLVVAADEGVMPQTKEHLAICNLLGIKSGIVVVTKIDLVDKEWLQLVIDDIKEFIKGTFLEGADILPVSSKTGENIPLLKDKIHEYSLKVSTKPAEGVFRLPIDRVFTLKGFGTVVTGTAVSGRLAVDDKVEILPAGIHTKARTLQSHGTPIKYAIAGQRVAINLHAVEKEDLKRGDMVLTPDIFRPTQAVDVKLHLLRDAPELKNKSPVHFHLYTSETVGRVILYDKETLKPGETCYAQIRLQSPVVASAGDRFVIRRFSPVETIGGGIILDPYPKKRKKKEGIEDLIVYEKGNLKEKLSMKVLKSGLKGIPLNTLKGWINTTTKDTEKAIDNLKNERVILQYDGSLIHREIYEKLKVKILDTLRRFHKNNPLKSGMEKETLRSLFGLPHSIFDGILSLTQETEVEKDIIRLRDFKVALTDRYRQIRDETLRLLTERAYQPLSREELAEYFSLKTGEVDDILKLMVEEGVLKRINDTFYLTKEHYDEMLRRLRNFFQKKDRMTVGEFRDLLNTSRKYALPFLEHLDSNKITLRVEDVRKPHPNFLKSKQP
jgi:selenocysteine-specific elongation factor